MKVLVGSQNSIKIEATQKAFSSYCRSTVEVIDKEVDSNVSNQPIGEETFRGAENRALNLKDLDSKRRYKAEFFVGLEGGIIKNYSVWFEFTVVCIVNRNGEQGFGTSSHFPLKPEIVQKLLEGKELGEVMAEESGIENIKQREGAIGFYTNNLLTRKDLCWEAVVVALIPFRNNL